jgi:diadenosine tetraphosphate (Ap4A) HIT family hydrolase
MSVAGARSDRRPGHEAGPFVLFLQTCVEKIGLRGFIGNRVVTATETQVEDCIFCLRHDPALNKIMCENDGFFARYDNFPSAPGHVEIIPKRHVESFFELTDDEVSEAYSLILDARKRIVAEFNYPDGYTIGINEGRAAGRSVDHLHIHLIPRYTGDVKDPRGGIRQAAPNCDPDTWK